MDDIIFATVLKHAFGAAASGHGKNYMEGAAKAWGTVGASYLGFALCGLSQKELRNIQYSVREEFGPVILDCKWYDSIKSECLQGGDSVQALLPGAGGTLHSCTITESLFLEMLDFCREG